MSNQIMPFSGVKPIKIIGANPRLNFFSVLNEGKVIYMSGRNLIVQNTKNNQQKIVYTHQQQSKIIIIKHFISVFSIHFIVILTKDLTDKYIAIYFKLNECQTYGLSNKNELKYIDLQVEEGRQIKDIQIISQGQILIFLSKFKLQSDLVIVKCSNGSILYTQQYTKTNILYCHFNLNQQYFLGILVQNNKGTFFQLRPIQDLSSKIQFQIKLQRKQQIIQFVIQNLQVQYNILILLTSLGFVRVYKITKHYITEQNKINVKINKNQDNRLSIQNQIQLLKPIKFQSVNFKIILTYNFNKIFSILHYTVYSNKFKLQIISDAFNFNQNITKLIGIKLARDGCNAVVLLQINGNQSSNNTSLRNSLVFKQSAKQMKSKYIQLGIYQLNLFNQMIQLKSKQMTYKQTLSIYGTSRIQYTFFLENCNLLFIISTSCNLKCYDITPQYKSFSRVKYNLTKLQLWSHQFKEQPLILAVHPNCFTLALLYQDIIKIHNFSVKCLFPAVVIVNTEQTYSICYSKYGDKLILLSLGAITIIDSYSYKIINKIYVSHLTSLNFNQNQSFRSITGLIQCPYIEYTGLNKVMFVPYQNTISIIQQNSKYTNFGVIQNSYPIKNFAYDAKSNNIVVLTTQDVRILSKPSLTQGISLILLEQIKLKASCLFLMSDFNALFIGGEDGILYLYKWLYGNADNRIKLISKTYLFQESIKNIYCSRDKKQIYIIGQCGNFILCQFNYISAQNMSLELIDMLISNDKMVFLKNEYSLVAKSQQIKKDIYITKVKINLQRGKSPQSYDSDQEIQKNTQNKLQDQIKQIQQDFARQIKQYQNLLGIQKMKNEILLLQDQFRVSKRKHYRDLDNIQQEMQKNIVDKYYDRKNNEKQKQQIQRQLLKLKNIKKRQFQKQLKQLIQSYQKQLKEYEVSLMTAKQSNHQKTKQLKFKYIDMQEDHQQQNIFNKQQLQKYLQQKNKNIINLTNKNRQIAIYILNLQQKLSFLGQQNQKIIYNLNYLITQKNKLQITKQQIDKQQKQKKQLYDYLMDQSRNLQTKVFRQRKLADQKSYYITQMQKQLAILQKNFDQIQSNLNAVGQNIGTQLQQKQHHIRQIQLLKQKLINLKNMKRNKQYKKSQKKSAYDQYKRQILRKLQIDQKQFIQQIKNSIQIQYSKNIVVRQKQQLLKKCKINDKMSEDVERWNNVKTIYTYGFRQNLQRLNQQHTKITYKYNDMARIGHQYRSQLNQLKQKIHLAKTQSTYLSIKNNRTKYTKNDNKDKKDKSKIPNFLIKKKGTCISLHQQSGKFITQT